MKLINMVAATETGNLGLGSGLLVPNHAPDERGTPDEARYSMCNCGRIEYDLHDEVVDVAGGNLARTLC